jgi:hypothetical protein
MSNSSLPNKKVLIVASVCITVVLVSFSYKLNQEKKALLTRLGGGQVVAGATDGLGQSDARVEAALQQTRYESIADIQNPFLPSAEDNTSDSFAKNIFSAYIKYDQDKSVNTENLVSGIVNQVKTNDLPKEKYTMSDIKVFVINNKDQIRKYGNDFGAIYLDGIAPVQSDPTKYNTSLRSLAGLYKNVSLKLLTLNVPNTVSVPHLQLVNAFDIISESLPLIEDQAKDPVKSLLALRLVQDSMVKQIELFKTINNYFKQNDIIFASDEPGFVWGITTGQNN